MRTKHAFLVIALLISATASLAKVQTLAEVARATRENRLRVMKEHPLRLWTNDNLPSPPLWGGHKLEVLAILPPEPDPAAALLRLPSLGAVARSARETGLRVKQERAVRLWTNEMMPKRLAWPGHSARAGTLAAPSPEVEQATLQAIAESLAEVARATRENRIKVMKERPLRTWTNEMMPKGVPWGGHPARAKALAILPLPASQSALLMHGQDLGELARATSGNRLEMMKDLSATRGYRRGRLNAGRQESADEAAQLRFAEKELNRLRAREARHAERAGVTTAASGPMVSEEQLRFAERELSLLRAREARRAEPSGAADAKPGPAVAETRTGGEREKMPLEPPKPSGSLERAEGRVPALAPEWKPMQQVPELSKGSSKPAVTASRAETQPVPSALMHQESAEDNGGRAPSSGNRKPPLQAVIPYATSPGGGEMERGAKQTARLKSCPPACGDLKSPLPKEAKPVGLVEWPSGKVQAILTEGDTVRLVEDEQVLAETQRLFLAPSSVTDSIDKLSAQATPPPTQKLEEEADGLPTAGEAPRDSEPAVAGESAPDHRGQTEGVVGLAESRPPAVSHGGEDGLREADLPGLQETPVATKGKLEAAKRAPLGTIHEPKSARGETPAKAIPWAGASPGTPRKGFQMIPTLGIVEWLDGRVQAIIPAGDSVLLVEEGQTFADGSRVAEITSEAVMIQLPAESPAGSTAKKEGHARRPVSHLTQSPSGDSELLLNRSIQDNQSRPREE